MIYIFGVIGLVAGFILGQMILIFLLNGVSQEDLLNDKYLKMKYGLLNWGVAILGSYSFVFLYEQYFV